MQRISLQQLINELDITKSQCDNLNPLKRISELWEGKDLKKTTYICHTPQSLKDIFNTEAKHIGIAASVIQDHKTRHREIDSFDYFLIGDMLDNIDSIYQDEKSNVKYILASKLGRWYRLSLKSLSDKKEIWVESLVSSSNKDKFFKYLKNKKIIYDKHKTQQGSQV